MTDRTHPLGHPPRMAQVSPQPPGHPLHTAATDPEVLGGRLNVPHPDRLPPALSPVLIPTRVSCSGRGRVGPSGSLPSRSWSVSLCRACCEVQGGRQDRLPQVPPRCPPHPPPGCSGQPSLADADVTATAALHARGSRRDVLPPAQPRLLGKVVIALRLLPQIIVLHTLAH